MVFCIIEVANTHLTLTGFLVFLPACDKQKFSVYNLFIDERLSMFVVLDPWAVDSSVLLRILGQKFWLYLDSYFFAGSPQCTVFLFYLFVYSQVRRMCFII